MVIVHVQGLTPAILCPYSSSEQAIRRSYIEGIDTIHQLGSGLTSTIPGLYKSEQAIRRSYIEGTGNVIIHPHGSGVTPTIPRPYKSSQDIKWSCMGNHNIIIVELDKCLGS